MADCVSSIQKDLESLHVQGENILSTDSEGTITDTIKYIHNTYINSNLKTQERESANAYLLSTDIGIPSILKTFLLSKNFRNVKLECFKLLNDIIELSSQHVQEYGSDIQSVCLLYIKHDVGAEVKKACLITLSKVLEACRGFQVEKKIKPESLIEALFFQLCRGSKLAPKVKEEILCLIGIIAHYYPEDFLIYQERVISMYLQELKAQVKVKAKSPNLSTVAGCLQGLKEYMYNFPVLCSEDQENSFFIFDISRHMAVKSEKYFDTSASAKRSTSASSACKAGLQMIAAHAQQFSQFVFENCKDLYEKLKKYLSESNRDMQKLGREAVIAVLKVTSEMIMSEYMNAKSYCKEIFIFFLTNFRETFLSSNTNAKELHVAVVGFGLFAGPCKLCLSEIEVKRMLQTMIQKSEHAFFSETTNLNDSIMVLPCYIESLAFILSNTDFIPENTLFSIEKLVIFQINEFPKVPSAYNFVVSRSIIHILVALQPKGEVFGEFLSEIVYQGLVKTCSHPVPVEADNLKDKISSRNENEPSDYQSGKESNMKITTYKDYMYLWKNMLNVIQMNVSQIFIQYILFN